MTNTKTLVQHEIATDQARHESLKKKNDMVTPEVERFKNRQTYLNEVKTLKIKKCWVVSWCFWCMLQMNSDV